MDRALTTMIEAARAGGEIALAHFEKGVEARLKPDGSPVTAADREAEAAIVAVLRRAFPDHGVLGEEHGMTGPAARRFVVDPIDGTRNFVRGLGVWATLIALEEEGEVTAGLVYQPVTGDLHVARKGGGAFLNDEPIRVSTVDALRRATLVHATLNLIRRSGDWDGFVRLVDATERQRGFGDFLCYTVVAEGTADIALSVNVKPWDLAPLRLLVEEAGGRFTDLGGVPTITSGTGLATNGLLHEPALTLLRAGPSPSPPRG